MRIYTPDGEKAQADKDQISTLLEAGWTIEKPEKEAPAEDQKKVEPKKAAPKKLIKK